MLTPFVRNQGKQALLVGMTAADTVAQGCRESIEVRESTRVVLGDIQNKRVVRCSLDYCLSNPGNFRPQTTPLKYRPPLTPERLARGGREEQHRVRHAHVALPGGRRGDGGRVPNNKITTTYQQHNNNITTQKQQQRDTTQNNLSHTHRQQHTTEAVFHGGAKEFQEAATPQRQRLLMHIYLCSIHIIHVYKQYVYVCVYIYIYIYIYIHTHTNTLYLHIVYNICVYTCNTYIYIHTHIMIGSMHVCVTLYAILDVLLSLAMLWVCSCTNTVEHMFGDHTSTPTGVLLYTLRPRVLKSLLQLSSLCNCLPKELLLSGLCPKPPGQSFLQRNPSLMVSL